MPTVGSSLATFLGNRLSMSFTNLGCDAFGLTNPVTVTAAGNGAGHGGELQHRAAAGHAPRAAGTARPGHQRERDARAHRDRDRDDRDRDDRDRDDRDRDDHRDRTAAATVAVARPPPLAALRYVTSPRNS